MMGMMKRTNETTRPQSKPVVTYDYIEVLDGEPRVGERCRIRCWLGNAHYDLYTSAVADWWSGYPYAIGQIRIETRNKVYTGRRVDRQ